MSNMMKDLAVLLFSAGEEIERKAEEYRQAREERQADFEQKIERHKEECKGRYQDDFDCMKEKVAETAGKIGLATKDDIDELKQMLKDLAEKVEKSGQ